MTETSAVYYLTAHRVSCNENNESVISDSENDDTTETSVICDLHAQEVSCDKCDISMTNTEDSSITETSAVHHLSTHRVSHNENDESVMSETDSITETSAVYHQYAQRASCVMSEEISDVTEAHTVQCLSA